MIGKQIESAVAGVWLIIAIVIASFLTWAITSNEHRGEVNRLVNEHIETVAGYQKTIKDAQDAATEAAAAEVKRAEALNDALAKLDKKYSEDLRNAKSDNDALRRSLSDQSMRMLIEEKYIAGCVADRGTTSEDTTARSLGDAAAIGLTGEGGQIVLDIRQGIIEDRAKINYLQSFVNDIVIPP